jgi:hypothetical protein
VGAVERSRPQAAVPKRKADADALRPVAAAAVGSVRDTLKEQGLPASGNVTFVQARTAHEIAKAHLARLRLQEQRGELVDRASAAALVFRLAREERDSWINWPARVAALSASSTRIHRLGSRRRTRQQSAVPELSLSKWVAEVGVNWAARTNLLQVRLSYQAGELCLIRRRAFWRSAHRALGAWLTW